MQLPKAKNHAGYAVHALVPRTGWTQIGDTRATADEAADDRASLPVTRIELSVREVLRHKDQQP